MARPRRPAPLRVRGVVASRALAALLVLAAAAGCESDRVAIASRHGLSAADRAACRALVRALPRTLAGELRRSVDPDDALGAAWGDPAYVLRCGVSMPSSFDRFSTCEVANGVGWFAPPSQADDQAVDVSLTTVGWSPAVSILVPAAGRPEGVAAAIAALAAPVKRHLRKVKDCG